MTVEVRGGTLWRILSSSFRDVLFQGRQIVLGFSSDIISSGVELPIS